MRRASEGPSFPRPVVWVMGASRGIGKEIAKQFASVGCEVCLSGRDTRALRTVAREILSLGGRAHVFPADIRKPASVQSACHRIVRSIGKIDVLVNNAAITVFKRFADTSLPEFNDILSTNLAGAVCCVKCVLPSMMKRKRGMIVNILSNAAVKTFEGSAAYTAAKSGLLGFARVLREEMREHSVKVVNVVPGATDTEMWSAEIRRRYGYRMMSPKSVAEAVLAVYQLPPDVVVDEIHLRPILGDLS